MHSFTLLGLDGQFGSTAALAGGHGQAADLKLRFLSSSEIKTSKFVLILELLGELPPTA
jgi:hypothetical protein